MGRRRERAGSILGSALGVIVFLGGIALLLLTFKLAYDMFTVPPADTLGVRPNQPLKLEQAGQSLATIIVRILLLIVMAVVGSLVANRGVSLISGTTRPQNHQVKGDTSESPEKTPG